MVSSMGTANAYMTYTAHALIPARDGVMALVESWRLPSSGWAVLYAILSIVAGFVVLLAPISSTVFLVIFAGCALVVMGIFAIVRAFSFGKVR